MNPLIKEKMDSYKYVKEFDKSIIDRFGYVDQKKRLENIMREGMELKVHRSGFVPSKVDGLSPKQIMEMKEALGNDIVFEDKVDQFARMQRTLNELDEKFKVREKELLEERKKKIEQEKVAEKEAIIKEYVDKTSKVTPEPGVKEV